MSLKDKDLDVKGLITKIADTIDGFEVSLNEVIKNHVINHFGLTPIKVAFRGGLFEAGFGSSRKEVEVELSFLLPISFETFEKFSDWHDGAECDADLDKWGFGVLLDASNSHFLEAPYDDNSGSRTNVYLTIYISEHTYPGWRR